MSRFEELPDAVYDEIGGIQVTLTLPFHKLIVLQNKLMKCRCLACTRLALELTTQMAASVCEADLSPLASSVMDQCMATNMDVCRRAFAAANGDDD